MGRQKTSTSYHIITFGGISVILIGDFAQLPLVGDKPLFAPEGKGSHGHTIYKLFNKVVILDQVIRQSGTSTESIQFREILMRLRNGEADWTTLLQRTPAKVKNIDDINETVHLYYKKDVAQYNHKAITQLGTPIARVNAIHSCTAVASAKSDEVGGLKPVIFIAVGAEIMLTKNLWQQTGLCNGATGTIDNILYASNQKPPNLPIAVLINFHQYTGPPFIPEKPKCIPVAPMVLEHYQDNNYH